MQWGEPGGAPQGPLSDSSCWAQIPPQFHTPLSEMNAGLIRPDPIVLAPHALAKAHTRPFGTQEFCLQNNAPLMPLPATTVKPVCCCLNLQRLLAKIKYPRPALATLSQSCSFSHIKEPFFFFFFLKERLVCVSVKLQDLHGKVWGLLVH